MFYCTTCGNERSWPTRYTSVSRGNCELCGTDGIQHDVQSKLLPKGEAVMAEDIVGREQAAKEFYERETGMKLIAWCVETKFFWMGKASAAAEITVLRKERDELVERAAAIAESHAVCGCNGAHGSCLVDDPPKAIAEEIRAALGERTG